MGAPLSLAIGGYVEGLQPKKRNISYISKPSPQTTAFMLKNYFSLALRHLRQNKMHAVLNIAGLSAGMAVTILIALWIVDECSYDKYNPAYDRIARVMQTGTLDGERYTYSSMPIPLAGELRASYGRAFKYIVPAYWAKDYVLSTGD